MAILELNEVSYLYKNRYQAVKAVDKVSCCFQLGVMYALIGKSGSGKTTLLSLLAGLDTPTSGQILYEGKDLRELNKDAYRQNHVATIYQGYNLFPLLNGLENVVYPLQLKRMPNKEARLLASEKWTAVGLTEQQKRRFPSMLSGGEQQRVAIARALALNAKIILADEPTGNLDSENAKNIVSLLETLAHEENCCVIIVTHDESIALCADVTYRMADGSFVQQEH